MTDIKNDVVAQSIRCDMAWELYKGWMLMPMPMDKNGKIKAEARENETLGGMFTRKAYEAVDEFLKRSKEHGQN